MCGCGCGCVTKRENMVPKVGKRVTNSYFVARDKLFRLFLFFFFF